MPRADLAHAAYRWVSGQVGAVLAEQLAQHRAVAAVLGLAVAADGDVRLVRKGRDQLEQVSGLGVDISLR